MNDTTYITKKKKKKKENNKRKRKNIQHLYGKRKIRSKVDDKRIDVISDYKIQINVVSKELSQK